MHIDFDELAKRALEREMELVAVRCLIEEYLQGIPADPVRWAETNRLYVEARAKALGYGVRV